MPQVSRIGLLHSTRIVKTALIDDYGNDSYQHSSHP